MRIHHHLDPRARQACCDLFAFLIALLIGWYGTPRLIHWIVDVWWTS